MSSTKFTDRHGVEWNCATTFGTFRRVKEILNLDLNAIVKDGTFFTKIGADTELLVNLLFVVLEPQAKERGISDMQFFESFLGETIEAAMEALVEGLLAFFPEYQRGSIKKIWMKTKRVQTIQAERMIAKIDSPVMDKAIEAELQKLDKEMDLAIGKMSKPTRVRKPRRVPGKASGKKRTA